MDLRSPLGKVKGLGSAHAGSHHWWMQRVTAIALIGLVIWFVNLVLRSVLDADPITDYLRQPFNAIVMIIFIGTALYHGVLGMRVIIEDYVHCSIGRPALLIIINFFTIATAVAAIIAVLSIYLGKEDPNNKKYYYNKVQQERSVKNIKSDTDNTYQRWKQELIKNFKTEE